MSTFYIMFDGTVLFHLAMRKLKRALVFKYLKKCHALEGQTRTNRRQILAHSESSYKAVLTIKELALENSVFCYWIS